MRIRSNNYLGILTLLALPTTAFTIQVRANDQRTCACSLQDPQDPTNLTWNTYWESDFTKMTSTKDLAGDFRFMVNTVQRPATTGEGTEPAGRDFDVDNVLVDAGQGLRLTVSPVDSLGEAVKSGGVYTQRLALGCM
jgi:hypothetical protein